MDNLQDLFSRFDPVGTKMRFHLRAGMSFTGVVDAVHRSGDGRIHVIELVPGHRSMGGILYIGVQDVCAIAFVDPPPKAHNGVAGDGLGNPGRRGETADRGRPVSTAS
jgi:hypothetical protein